MKIKGKTTIQLFDANNQLKHEVVEENIITKAVSRIATLEGREFLLGLRTGSFNVPYYHLPGITPLATELFGGLLLFEDSIPEDEETFYPPVQAKPVGHAGAPYSGPNPHRGTYNASESGVLYSGTAPIGYRHVWDFATDRANGKIGCICLTSKAGGNTGWKSQAFSADTNNVSLFDADTFTSTHLCAGLNANAKPFSSNFGRGGSFASSLTPRGASGRVLYLNDETGEFYFFSSSGDIQVGILPPSITLGLDTTVFAGFNETPLTTLFKVSSSLNNRTFAMFDRDAKTFTFVVPVSASKIERRVYTVSGQSSTTTIDLSGASLVNWSNTAVPPFFYKGKTYALIQVEGAIKLGEFDDEGALIQSFDWSAMANASSMYVFYSRALDKIILRSRYTNSQSYGTEVFFNGTSFEVFRPGDFGTSDDIAIVESQDDKTPGFYCTFTRISGGSYITELFYCFRTNYLASINNIASPVIKTTGDTMKITYDIYMA